MKKDKKILIFHIGHLGDTVIILPSLHLLRSSYPTASFYLLTDKILEKRYISAAELFSHTDYFEQVFTFLKSKHKVFSFIQYFSLFILLPKLFIQKFDIIFYLMPSARMLHHVKRDEWYFKILGIKARYGFTGFEKIQQKLQAGYIIHESDAILGRLADDDFECHLSAQRSFDLQLCKKEQQKIDRWLKNQPGDHEHRLLIGFGPFSKMPAKQWPLDRFQIVGEKLIHEYDIWPIIFGGNEDKKSADDLLRRWNRGFNAAGVLTIRESAEALRRCALYVGNDTGTMHLAAAVNTPCVAIFSARDIPGKWYPIGDNHIVLRARIDCELCNFTVCKHNRCLKNITTEQVYFSVKQQLDRILVHE